MAMFWCQKMVKESLIKLILWFFELHEVYISLFVHGEIRDLIYNENSRVVWWGGGGRRKGI